MSINFHCGQGEDYYDSFNQENKEKRPKKVYTDCLTEIKVVNGQKMMKVYDKEARMWVWEYIK